MPIEHPLPTPATAKSLYAHAFRCGYEGCNRPLYKVDDRTGQRKLNSRICHINARSEGGSRWDPLQSPEENRSEGNLILMCLEHSASIDDDRTVDDYPPSLLRDWKAQQVAEYDRLRQGWMLDDEMAVTAIAESAVTQLSFTNSEVNLGGAGGASPGAGGGGGGAIGPNSRGGDGGSGGDYYSGLIDFPNEEGVCVKELRVTVGKGGRAAYLPGQHGQMGEDSTVELLSEEGTVLHKIRVKGGEGGRSGSSHLPEGSEEVSLRDIENGLRVTTFMTLNCGELRDGLLFVLGGGWSQYFLPSIPHDVIWNFAFVLSWGEASITSPKGIFISLHDPDDTEKACVALAISSNAQTVPNHTGMGAIGATIEREGLWRLRITSGGFLLSELAVQVRSTAVI